MTLNLNVPPMLSIRPQWVLWRRSGTKKVPVHPRTLKPVNITLPDCGTSFDFAFEALRKAPSMDGLGVVLNGDGIVGVDIDHCMDQDKPHPLALQWLEDIGCNYVEISPSGKGLRGFGTYIKTFKGYMHKHGNFSVELYSHDRFVTFTGQRLVDDRFTGELSTLFLKTVWPPLKWDTEVTQETQATQETQVTQARGGGDTLAFSIDQLPSNSIPTAQGQRNRCLFHFARYLKGAFPLATCNDLRQHFDQWLDHFIDIIGTKDYDESWNDFVYAFNQVSKPHGEVLKLALSAELALPKNLPDPGLGELANSILTICFKLDRYHSTDHFFLSCRVAATEVGISYRHAAKLLKNLTALGYLILIESGVRQRASVYRLGPMFKNL